MRKDLFKTALAGMEGLHFAAHSHHLWPDCSLQAQTAYWQDSARLADRKWEKIFTEIIPAAQGHVARHLNLSSPDNIAFAPNTHELVNRILSCLPERPLILTTDSEFHSLSRQLARLEEEALVRVRRVPTLPHDTFPERFAEAAKDAVYDLVIFSQVFFNSGYAVPALDAIAAAITAPESFIVIDSYHGFMALPTDLSALENRIFYLAGGYKYAMSGEGACFLHCPPGYGLRPRNTGWFADMGSLEKEQNAVAYASDGFRFWGATFDPSGLYRFNAVMEMLASEDLTVEKIHAHIIALEDYFLKNLKHRPGVLLTPVENDHRGHFLSFETSQAQKIHDELLSRGIVTDYRGDRLRFGFGLYHDERDIDRLLDNLLECDFVKAA